MPSFRLLCSNLNCRSGFGSKSRPAPSLKLQEWIDLPFGYWPTIYSQIRLKSLETISQQQGYLEGNSTQQRSQPTPPSDYRLITEAFEESEIDYKLPTIISVSTIIAFIKAFIHWQRRSGFTAPILCLTGNTSAHHHHFSNLTS